MDNANACQVSNPISNSDVFSITYGLFSLAFMSKFRYAIILVFNIMLINFWRVLQFLFLEEVNMKFLEYSASLSVKVVQFQHPVYYIREIKLLHPLNQ